MPGSITRLPLRRRARLSAAAAIMTSIVPMAWAGDDAGMHDFFAAGARAVRGGSLAAPIAGGRLEPAGRVAAARRPRFARAFESRRLRQARADTGLRPLLVRLHDAGPPPSVASLGTPSAGAEPVSIFEDRTLRRGDAVMTRDGVRIFSGSASWPHRPTDFVAVAETRGLDKATAKMLTDLDRAPRI